MVTVREAIANMVDNHEKCMEVVKKLEPYMKRKHLYTKFIKLIYTETVFKQRGKYVFYDKSNAIQDFCILDGIKNNYPEYYLYDYFCRKQISGEKLFTDEVMTVCDKKYADQQKTDEGFNAMRNRLQLFIAQLKEKISELNSEWQEVENGSSILSTSKELLKNAEAELKGME
jgi:exonuclease VII small subunit